MSYNNQFLHRINHCYDRKIKIKNTFVCLKKPIYRSLSVTTASCAIFKTIMNDKKLLLQAIARAVGSLTLYANLFSTIGQKFFFVFIELRRQPIYTVYYFSPLHLSSVKYRCLNFKSCITTKKQKIY